MRTRVIATIFVGTILLTNMGHSYKVIAQTNVNVGIKFPPPPPLVIPTPPPVMVIPNTYVYFAPEVDADILFYQGYWYRPYKGHWYKSVDYKGSWGYIGPDRVPPALLHLPPNFRHVPPGHQHIPHGQLKKNWKTWEKERHWDNRESRHAGKGRHDMENREHKSGSGRGEGK